MDIERSKALLETSLERAAETIGDITPQVMSLYYARHPEAVAAFDRLAPNKRVTLEQQMVEQGLYALMDWNRASTEIEVVFLNAVPHHADILDVRPELFADLLTAICDTIVATIPEHETEERAVWRDLNEAMQALVRSSARHAIRSKQSV